MKLLKVCANVDRECRLILPMESANLEGFRPGDEVSALLAVPEDEEFPGLMAFVGSGRKGGNTSKIVDAICTGIKENGHSVEIYDLSELNNKGCRGCCACQANKVEYCSINDQMTALLPKIADADCIIMGTPIYMLQVSGYTKNFLDRLFAFFVQSNDTVKYLPGKKYITATCSGAPAGAFKNVTEYLDQIFGGYSKMVNAGSIIAGGLAGKDDILSQPEILKQAKEIGRKLN